ncbi:MAG: HPr family phosphocarrier protein [Eubacteriales bacterium]|nr:HPr family phosphocarrier protein [Eubacteriales bacterium]
MLRKSVCVVKKGEIERNAALLVQTASLYDSRIHVSYANKTINAKSIMGVMTLPLTEGNTVDIIVDGADEETAMNAIIEFFEG